MWLLALSILTLASGPILFRLFSLKPSWMNVSSTKLKNGAVREGNTAKARLLQKLIMRSVAARFLVIRQVTQLNNGKKTAGIDGKLALDFKERFELEQKLKPQAFQLEASRATFYSNPQEGRLKADTKSTNAMRKGFAGPPMLSLK